MIFLQKYGISTTLAAKIYQHYGQNVYRVIEENPYQIADHVTGVGFKTADEIAAKVGIHTDSDYRIRSGIFYTLLQIHVRLFTKAFHIYNRIFVGGKLKQICRFRKKSFVNPFLHGCLRKHPVHGGQA